MSKSPRIGLWLPPRTDLSEGISLENPAHIDFRIREKFLAYLGQTRAEIVEVGDFRNAVLHNDRILLEGEALHELDHLVWMGMLDRTPGSYHLEVLRSLSFHVQLHNSWEFYREATDKFSAFSLLHRAGMPVSDLYLVNRRNYRELEPLFKQNRFLLKPRRGSFGQGIIRLNDFEQLRDTLEYFPRQTYYLEKFYENDPRAWTGVTVVNGEVIYGFRKEAGLVADWKIYDPDSKGGQVQHVKPNEEITRLARRVGEVLGGNYYGLDFILTSEGYRIVDINCSPGLYWDFMEELKIPLAAYFFRGIV